ncbi:hypothetical protein L211DRAFT_476902 [Terfezia boudieri ATCC MYA-4762]|uniref:Uncharacterized protein n=1 Tax=Terfezia boudieri ATCC MYA-4762 TaxID=1051890 RepID=A0A3N4LYK6_9PEZI|nr:hypothetical protein L211DRAFT_476902 [Terfezia boudieri ATCC MYA-4762]
MQLATTVRPAFRYTHVQRPDFRHSQRHKQHLQLHQNPRPSPYPCLFIPCKSGKHHRGADHQSSWLHRHRARLPDFAPRADSPHLWRPTG